MKKLLFCFCILLFTTSAFAQPTFNLGIKAGLNNSKITFKPKEFTSESILKTHIGAFMRIGWNVIYVQPEAYFSAKGSDVISTDPQRTAGRFNFNNVDVPVLLGAKVFEGESFNFRIMAGPVFSLIVSDEIKPEDLIDKQYYEDNYFGFQYGAGIDVGNFFLDFRMEHGSNNMYYHPSQDLNGKNQTFMVTAGFKIL